MQNELMNPEIFNHLPFLRLSAFIFLSISLIASGLCVFLYSINKNNFKNILEFIRHTGFLIAWGLLCAMLNEQVSLLEISTQGVFLSLACFLGLFTLIWEKQHTEQNNAGVTLLFSASIWLLIFLTPHSPPNFTQNHATSAESYEWLITLHVGTAILGESLALIGFLCSLLYLWGYARLKNSQKNNVTSLNKKYNLKFLPSLDVLDVLFQKLSLSVLIFMTLSLGTGFALVSMQNGAMSVSQGKILWAIGIWIWSILCLVGRELWGWKGRKSAFVSLCGVGLMGICLFGTIWGRS